MSIQLEPDVGVRCGRGGIAVLVNFCGHGFLVPLFSFFSYGWLPFWAGLVRGFGNFGV